MFLSRLIVERMVLLRGARRGYLIRLAGDLGLVDRYLKALRSPRRWRRARAAENLGYFGGERSVGPLGELLSDEEDETIRAVAARSLARIGSGEAVRLLAETLDDPSELTRLRVAENLERVGPPAIGPLVQVLEESGGREERMEGPIQAIRVLGHLRASEARSALGRAAVVSGNVDLRAQATLALGKIGDPDDVDKILAAAEDEEWPVRAQAANALGMIGEVSTVPTLRKLTQDGSWWVRLNSCKALANMGPEGEKALVEILLGDDHYARERAAATLETRGITRRMVKGLAKPGKRGVRARAVVEALILSGATRHLRGLAESIPESEERGVLRRLLEEHATQGSGQEADKEEAEVLAVAVEQSVERALEGPEEPQEIIEAAGAEPLGTSDLDLDPENVVPMALPSDGAEPGDAEGSGGAEPEAERSDGVGVAIKHLSGESSGNGS